MDKLEELARKERELEAKYKQMIIKSKPVAGIRLDILVQLISELDSNPQLQQIFGSPVSSKLALISASDFGIFETKEVKLTEEQKIIFLKTLHEILQTYKIKYASSNSLTK